MDSQQQRSKARAQRFSEAGKQMDEAVGRATQRLEQECERLIAYLNNEVVPAVRQKSSRGLRQAAEKLARFADYLESNRPS
jgi:ribosomal protein S15P/S13E